MLCFGKAWICESRTLGLLSVQWSTQKQVSCLGSVADRLVACSKLSCFLLPSFLPSFLSSSVLPIFIPSSFNFVLVRQLHREFQRAGADVIQAFTFSLDDDWEGDHAKYGVCIVITTVPLLCKDRVRYLKN